MSKKQEGQLDNFYTNQKLPLAIRALRFYFKHLGWIAPKKSAQLFWKLFTTPKSRQIKAWHLEFLATAKQNRFEIEGEEYLSYTWGAGSKTVVLLHGWEGMATDYKKMIDALLAEGEYRIIAVDFPAHGRAAGKQSNMLKFMAGIKHILLEEQRVYALVGHSLGANAAFFALAELKQKVDVEHFVMLGSYPVPYHFFKTFKNFMQIPHALFERIVDDIEQEKIGRSDLRKMNMYELRYKLPVKSVLLVHDEQDEVANIEKVKALAAEWDRVSVLFGEHGGHFKHFRHPEVIERILAKLRTMETTSGAAPCSQDYRS